MSVWSDMLKYNFKKKKIINAEGVGITYAPSISIEMDNTTEFKKIATITPELNGIIKQITVRLKLYQQGYEAGKQTIQIRDNLDNVLYEDIRASNGVTSFYDIPVKAFKTYNIYFKNSYDETTGYVLYVPERVSIEYSVVHENGYMTVKSAIE